MKTHTIKSDSFYITGTEALKDGFRRFSDEELKSIESVASKTHFYAKHSSGIQAHFKTSSKSITVSVETAMHPVLTNFSPIGEMGVDLYMFDEEVGHYRLIGVGRPSFNKNTYETNLVTFEEAKERAFILNFPLYQEVKEMFLKTDAAVYPHSKNQRKIMFYGTSILQGGCVSRPGLMYTNILSRELGVDILNYGFSGSAFNEVEVAQILSKRDVELFIIDSEANSLDNILINNLEAFVDTYRKHNPNTPIIIANRVPFIHDRISKESHKKKEAHDYFIKELVSRKEHMYFFDVYSMLKEDFEISCDGAHLNDYGSKQMATIFKPLIENHIKTHKIPLK